MKSSDNVLAELNIRHTRRHMPTRRVALGPVMLPTSGSALGAVLLAAVMAEFVGRLGEEQAELLPSFLHGATRGLSVPRIAMRYRLQTDVHGLDRSRHRIVQTDTGRRIIELDEHAHPAPQVIGAVMAAAALPPSARSIALPALERAARHPGMLPYGYQIHRRLDGLPGAAPTEPGTSWARATADDRDPWASVDADHRWAMEVLGLRAEHAERLERREVQRRFRRLVSLAHPDQGGASLGAAERIAELAEARELLLATLGR